MKHLITLFDVSTSDVEHIFSLTDQLREAFESGDRSPRFPGRVVGLLFEKPSLRTRVSFEAAISHLGGNCIYLGEDVGWGSRESNADFGRVVSQYLDVLVCRTRKQSDIEELASFASCPVINGLSELAHPCQALADLYTIQRTAGTLSDITVAYIGDGNNVARSLLLACAHLGVELSVATPKGYELDRQFVARVRESFPRLKLRTCVDPKEAVHGAVAVYTDVWASMGQEAEKERRKKDFAGYMVDATLMSYAAGNAVFMHCLPANRGQEVSEDVMDGEQSVVVQQACNRMHLQKGILAWLLEPSR